MNNKYNLLSFSLVLTLFLLMSTQAKAKQLFIYKDRQGSTLLTNKKLNKEKYTQVKATYYSDSNIHRYANWGSSESSVLPSYSQSRNAYDQMIQSAAAQYGVSAGLIKAVMHTESGFNAAARSPVGAQGLMQLMPATAQRFNVKNVYDPQENINAGAKYLSWLLKRFDGNTQYALAAYNAGENNVKKYGGIPPFRETQDYVKKVLNRYQHLYANSEKLTLSNSKTASASPSTPSNSQNISPSDSIQLYDTSSAVKRQIIKVNGVYTDRAIHQ